MWWNGCFSKTLGKRQEAWLCVCVWYTAANKDMCFDAASNVDLDWISVEDNKVVYFEACDTCCQCALPLTLTVTPMMMYIFDMMETAWK